LTKRHERKESFGATGQAFSYLVNYDDILIIKQRYLTGLIVDNSYLLFYNNIVVSADGFILKSFLCKKILLNTYYIDQTCRMHMIFSWFKLQFTYKGTTAIGHGLYI